MNDSNERFDDINDLTSDDLKNTGSTPNASAETYKEEPSASESARDGEYEVSFDSVTGDYSYIPTPGNTFSLHQDPVENTVFSSPTNEKSKKKSSKNKSSVLICISAIVLAVAIIICSASALLIALIGKLNVNGFFGDIFKSDSQTSIGEITNTRLTVNKSDLDVTQNAVSKATYMAYDSNLLIEAYADVNASTLVGTGSGVLWTADGYVVTCNHVVEGCSTVKVTFTDSTSYFVEKMATDPITDLALLKISLAEGSEVLPITARNTESTPLMLGETVIAIGNPLGYLTSTVTDGILSSLEREISVEGTSMSLMQISAAVNSGNSGGGLYDINGSLIGIVNAKIAGNNVEGIGFAIPIDTVIDVISQLAEKGYVSGRPQIGVDLVTVTNQNYRDIFSVYPDLEKYALTSGRWGMSSLIPGIYVVDISDSIKYSDNSGKKLKFGDRIYQVSSDSGDFITISDSQDILNFINSMKVGDTLHITVMRSGMAETVSVILGEKTAA